MSRSGAASAVAGIGAGGKGEKRRRGRAASRGRGKRHRGAADVRAQGVSERGERVRCGVLGWAGAVVALGRDGLGRASGVGRPGRLVGLAGEAGRKGMWVWAGLGGWAGLGLLAGLGFVSILQII